jgi:hypothetical protein
MYTIDAHHHIHALQKAPPMVPPNSLLRLSFACLLFACTSQSTQAPTKQEVASEGKSDSGLDLCQEFDWYGDGVCDGFCPMPDPDCCDGDQCVNTADFCFSSTECPAGEHCSVDDGDCLDPCENQFQGCADVCAGVCTTMSNDCSDSSECAQGQYCHFDLPTACGAGGFGRCQSKPAACSPQPQLVCGCDGTTYGSECEAAMAETSVASFGACPDAPLACNETAQCESGFFCQKNQGMCTQNVVGMCLPEPTDCSTGLDPVCGCDGFSYVNACMAQVAGVNIDHDGFCLHEGQ